MAKSMDIKKHISAFKIIIFGFLSTILIGTFILSMPISSASGTFTPFNEALFTSTSAVCVTGLIVQDTATYWSTFGHIIILLLIQIGGLGVITTASLISLIAGKRISLSQRTTIKESLAANNVGGIVKLTRFIVITTFSIEAIGAFSMMPVFCSDFGIRGIWLSVFHSVSAFCNAGFDIMGTASDKFCSLTSYIGNPVINITIMLLIIIGGIGFLTWRDIFTYRHHFKKYSMQSKVILTVTAVLIVLPTVYFFFFEFNSYQTNERILSSLFQSITARTAGFNTADLSLISGAGQCIMIILILIGGSSGSTAGGMKTSTVAVLFANIVSILRRKDEAQLFNRRIDNSIVKNAATILVLYLTLFISSGLVISIIENLPLSVCLFETASAIGTAGLTLGITTNLGIVSQIILILLMFFGRVGGLTVIYATASETNKTIAKSPKESITVG